MQNKDMGALNKKEAKQKQQIIVLLGAIIVVVLVVMISLNLIRGNKIEKINVSKIIENAETKLIFVENSDKSKCKKCSTIKKYLDSEKINYVTYDVSMYSKKEYNEMLKTVEINPDDFGYPAVIYLKEGRLYADVINLEDTKPVEDFIKTYDLKKVK